MAKEPNEKSVQDAPQKQPPKPEPAPEPKVGQFEQDGKVYVRERLGSGNYIVHRLS